MLDKQPSLKHSKKQMLYVISMEQCASLYIYS